MQNWFATLVLLGWPVIAIILFLKLPLNRAMLWTILGAQLLLPAGAKFKFEMVPQLDKATIPNFCILLGCMIAARRPLQVLRGFGFTDLLILAYLISPIATSLTNGEAILAGSLTLPGVGFYDAFSAVESSFIDLIPFLLARQFLGREHDAREIFRVLVWAMLLYSIPLLFEVRFSPQLHFWFYGYYSSDFQQAIREGGFRPMVFMGHGLLAAVFVMLATLASMALWRTRSAKRGLFPAGKTGYLGVVLILCKSLGAIVYGAILTPLVGWARPQLQMRAAIVLVAIALLYPSLRQFDLFPTDLIVEAAATLDNQRAQSLKERFDNENLILVHAAEKPMFGWGRYGRGRVYDTETGKDLAVTDGRWVITIGQFGLFGFLAEFGLLAIGVFRAASALKFARSINEKIYLASFSLLAAVSIIDLLPNSGLVPWIWLMSGALLGRAEALYARQNRPGTAGNRIGVPALTQSSA